MGLVVFLVLVFLVGFSDSYICTHEIYCRGRLLHDVQMKALFPDSKTFVDMKLKMPWHEIMFNFNKLINETREKDIPKAKMETFIKENFDPVASEFEKWNPPDWNQSPLFLKKIKDPRLWEFGKKLNGIWKFLGRRITDLVRENQELYSIIYVPYGMVVPGGRFREIYYWDSYWIIRGLLKSEMFYTARGIIANFVYMVRQYGLVPNGGRIYYTGRSQPPMLLPMVKSYMDATNDVDFLREHLDTLEKEYAFWLANRTVIVSKGNKEYRLARFYDESQGPRPESYREDTHTGSVYGTEKERNDFYSEIKVITILY